MINTVNKVLQESISLTNVLSNSEEIKNQIVSIVEKAEKTLPPNELICR